MARRQPRIALCGASALLLFVTMSLLSSRASDAADPPTTAFLRLETGTHTTSINQASVDAKSRWLLTVSTDKTARVWNVNTGKLEQILRPPILGDLSSSEGELLGGALSPDGTVAAVGGYTGRTWDTYSVYLFDRASGRLIRRIRDLPSRVNRLSYSPDGRWLAACLVSGLRVYDGSGSQVGEDTYNKRCVGADFDHSGRLVTSSLDSQIHLYAIEQGRLRRLAQRSAPGGMRPFDVRFSPNGALIAIGSLDGPVVHVLHTKTLSLAYAPNAGNPNLVRGSLSSVAWSADGKYLYAGGTIGNTNREELIIQWAEGGLAPFGFVDVAENTISGIVPLKDGRMVFTSQDAEWGVVSPQLEITAHEAQNVDFREQRLVISADGLKVGYNYDPQSTSPTVFDVGRRMFGSDLNGLVPPTLTAPGIDLRLDGPLAMLNDQPVEMPNVDVSTARSIALAPDAAGFAIGSDSSLFYFDRTGRIIWRVATSRSVWSVNFTRDGTLIVAALGDGTIRWFRRSDHREILAFFPHPDQKRWVLWTPSGYYDASPGGEDLIGWHVNRGADKAADLFPVSRFRASRYRPDVIAQILTTQDEDRAVAIADAQAGRAVRTASVNQMLPPVIDILSPTTDTRVSTSPVVLRFRVRTPVGAPPTALRVRVNGRNVALPGLSAVLSQPSEEKQIAVPISTDSKIALFAENRNNWSPEADLQVSWVSAAPKSAPITTLYVLAVGITKYKDAHLQNLHYAAKDADDFVRVVQAQKQSGIYRDVVVDHIPEDQADARHIREGLAWLSRQVGADDTGILFFSGHGEIERDIYYFLPVDADPDNLEPTAITKDEISGVLSRLAGKAVLFMDTCHAGRMAEAGRKGVPDITGVINELASSPNGIVVLASSTGREESEEDPKAQNGAFTEALVEGLSGSAQRDAKGAVTVQKLGDYLSDRVKQITNGRQHPVPDLGGIPDFPIAVAP